MNWVSKLVNPKLHNSDVRIQLVHIFLFFYHIFPARIVCDVFLKFQYLPTEVDFDSEERSFSRRVTRFVLMEVDPIFGLENLF